MSKVKRYILLQVLAVITGIGLIMPYAHAGWFSDSNNVAINIVHCPSGSDVFFYHSKLATINQLGEFHISFVAYGSKPKLDIAVINRFSASTWTVNTQSANYATKVINLKCGGKI